MVMVERLPDPPANYLQCIDKSVVLWWGGELSTYKTSKLLYHSFTNMILKCAVVFCLILVDFSWALRYNEGYSQYQGSPAPLNPDGTVAFTPEYQHIRDEHRAAFELEYQKIRDSINAADPYAGPNSLKASGNEGQGQYLPEIHEEEHYDSPSPVEDEGQYYADQYEKPYSSFYDDGQYRPHLYEQDHQVEKEEYSSPPLAQGLRSYAPTKLNADGTVTHPPEYNSIASSFLAYHQALSRHRRSTERYQSPPAPLNHDLTVDYTPEVKHVIGAHFSAIADQFKRLQATAALAAAHPDRTSPPSKDYNPQSNGLYGHFQGQYLARKKRSYARQYSSQQASAGNYDDGQYRPHLYQHDDGQYKHHLHKYDDGQYKHEQHIYDDGEYKPQLHYHENDHHVPQHYEVVEHITETFRPAPLNPDGTVAHLPEYHAIAASHQAAHRNALSAVPRHR